MVGPLRGARPMKVGRIRGADAFEHRGAGVK